VVADKAVNTSERLHSTMTVVVAIEDKNDNYPVFHSRDHVTVAEDEMIGYPLLLVAATDADRNNSIRYTIVSGDPTERFSLGRDTGKFRVWL